MKIIKKILIVLAVFVLLISAVGLIFFPSHIHVERKTTIDRKQDLVYNFVSDFHNWNSWSPWYQKDTLATYKYEGPSSGVGSTFTWESKNKEVGKGSMKIVEAKPDSVIHENLYFMEQKGEAHSTFRMTPEGNGTSFTWGFDMEAGANPLLRIMGSYMDGMIGKDFESGLLKLKTKLESMPELVTLKTDSI